MQLQLRAMADGLLWLPSLADVADGLLQNNDSDDPGAQIQDPIDASNASDPTAPESAAVADDTLDAADAAATNATAPSGAATPANGDDNDDDGDADPSPLPWAYVPASSRPPSMLRDLQTTWVVHTLSVAPIQPHAPWRPAWTPHLDALAAAALARSAAATAGVSDPHHSAAFLSTNVSACLSAIGPHARHAAALKREVAGVLSQLTESFSPRRISMEMGGQCGAGTGAQEGGAPSRRLRSLARRLGAEQEAVDEDDQEVYVSIYGSCIVTLL